MKQKVLEQLMYLNIEELNQVRAAVDKHLAERKLEQEKFKKKMDSKK